MRSKIYPRPHDKQIVYLKDVITNPNCIMKAGKRKINISDIFICKKPLDI